MQAYYRTQFENLVQWIQTDSDTSVVIKEDGNRTSIDYNNFPIQRPTPVLASMITKEEFCAQFIKAISIITKAIS